MIVLESAIWAGVVVYLLVRLETNFKAWLKSREPLTKVQYEKFDIRLNDLQNQINQVSVHKEFD